MSIDELIKKLQELRDEYGNKEVYIQGVDNYFEIQDVAYDPEDELYEDGFVIY